MVTQDIQRQCQEQLLLAQFATRSQIERPRTLEEMRSLDPAEQRKLHDKLNRIERALQRCSTSRYGICTECQQPIGADRLLALPTADLCISCQRQLEQAIATPYRKHRLTTTA